MSNKVSIKDIKAKVKASNADTIKFTFGSGENTIEIEFKPSLTLNEESAFIQRICDNSFDVNGNYLPEYKNILFSVTVMQMLSNLPIPKEKNNKGVDCINFEEYKMWDSIYQFVNTVYNANMNDKEQYKFAGYINHLENLVNDKIEYIKEQNLHKSKFDELCEELKEQINKFGDKFKDIDMKQFVEDLHKISSMVGNVDDKAIIDEILEHSKKIENDKNKVVNIKDIKQ